MSRSVPFYLLLPVLLAACDPQESPAYEGEPLAALRGTVTSNDSPPSEAQAAVLWLTSELEECQGPTLECSFGVSSMDETDFDCVEMCGYPECVPEEMLAWEECVMQCGGTVEAQAIAELETCAGGAIGERVVVNTDTFPSRFEIELYDLPSEDALLQGHDGGPRVAFGMLVALSPGAPDTFDLAEDSSLTSILGGVESHALIYAADPIPADSAWGQYLGGDYTQGFHLVQYDAEVDCDTPDDVCVVGEQSRSPAPDDLATEIELKLAPLGQFVLPL